MIGHKRPIRADGELASEHLKDKVTSDEKCTTQRFRAKLLSLTEAPGGRCYVTHRDGRQSMPIWRFKAIGRLSFVAARVIGRVSDPSVSARPVCGEGMLRSVAAGRTVGNRRCSETGRDAGRLSKTAAGSTHAGVVVVGTGCEPVTLRGLVSRRTDRASAPRGLIQ